MPRASIPTYLGPVAELAAATASLVVGCGHAGDGNVHLSVWQPDPDVRRRPPRTTSWPRESTSAAPSPASTGSAPHKRPFLAELEDPVKLDLMRRIKAAFDPHGILNPGTIFDRRAGRRAGARP